MVHRHLDALRLEQIAESPAHPEARKTLQSSGFRRFFRFLRTRFTRERSLVRNQPRPWLYAELRGEAVAILKALYQAADGAAERSNPV